MVGGALRKTWYHRVAKLIDFTPSFDFYPHQAGYSYESKTMINVSHTTKL